MEVFAPFHSPVNQINLETEMEFVDNVALAVFIVVQNQIVTLVLKALH